MTVQIIIPSFRAPEKLRRCLDCIERSNYRKFSLFVRDNSIDNVLFTAAVNEGILRGLRDSKTDYFLILNQDCYISQDTLGKLVEAMERDSSYGIVSPVQLGEDGKVSWNGSLEAFPFGRHQKNAPLADAAVGCFETFWANGACMMLRRAMVEEIGLLDRNLKFICSDSDYSFSARSRGWKVVVCQGTSVEHSLTTSGVVDGNRELERQKVADALYFCNKWLSGDLYRSLSYEGPSLHRIYVAKVKRHLEESVLRFGPPVGVDDSL